MEAQISYRQDMDQIQNPFPKQNWCDQKNHRLTAKSMHYLENEANQDLIKSQCDFRETTKSVAERIKHDFEETLSVTKISATQQQPHAKFLFTKSSGQTIRLFL